MTRFFAAAVLRVKRLDSCWIRPDSGGAGRWKGGNGGVRRVRFLEPMTASILSNGRRVPAFGIDGGALGAAGINRVEHAVSPNFESPRDVSA